MHSNWDAPQLHGDHPRPVTRRQFLSQGFMTGAAYTSWRHRAAARIKRYALADLVAGPRRATRPVAVQHHGWRRQDPVHLLRPGGRREYRRLNVLVGQEGGQSDFLSTQGYEKMGLPGDMVPGLNDP